MTEYLIHSAFYMVIYLFSMVVAKKMVPVEIDDNLKDRKLGNLKGYIVFIIISLVPYVRAIFGGFLLILVATLFILKFYGLEEIDDATKFKDYRVYYKDDEDDDDSK